ncbi:hypothetical protein SprV_0200737100 [Sparganum proliferum]
MDKQESSKSTEAELAVIRRTDSFAQQMVVLLNEMHQLNKIVDENFDTLQQSAVLVHTKASPMRLSLCTLRRMKTSSLEYMLSHSLEKRCLTCICCKIMEAIVKKATMEFLEQGHLLSDLQHGFRQNRSCLSRLLLSTEQWTRALDEDGRVDVIYTDFKKAFDSVPHKRLIYKLSEIGIRGRLLTGITDFLTGRSQTVCIEASTSTPTPVLSDVPQGSVLGPLLFLVYINDCVDDLGCSAILFADDVKLWRPIRSDADRYALQVSLNRLNSWSARWLLNFKVDKCVVLRLRTRRTSKEDDSFQYVLGGQPLSNVVEQKDLGVLMTSSLKPSSQCQRAAKKILHRINAKTKDARMKKRADLQKKLQPLLCTASQNRISTKVVNLSKGDLTSTEISLLSKGIRFSHTDAAPTDFQANLESLLLTSNVPDDMCADIHSCGTGLLRQRKHHQTLTTEEENALRSLRTNDKIVIMSAGKGGVTVIVDKAEYVNKANQIFDEREAYATLAVDPTKKQGAAIKKKVNKLVLLKLISPDDSRYIALNDPRIERAYGPP